MDFVHLGTLFVMCSNSDGAQSFKCSGTCDSDSSHSAA